jgi:flagellar motor switch protein FliN/FliY
MADENQEVDEAAVDPFDAAMEEVAEGLEQVAEAAESVADVAAGAIKASDPKTLDLILDVTLAVTIEVGRARMTVQDLLQLGQGSVIELEKLAGEPLDIFINGKKVATGEAVIVNEKFGVRLTEIISPEERVNSLS